MGYEKHIKFSRQNKGGRLIAWAAVSSEGKTEIYVTNQLNYLKKFNKPAPHKSSLYYMKHRLLETGSVVEDRMRSGRPVTARSDNIETVNAAIN